MSSYQQLAGAYDELTWDVGYEKRADFLEKLFRRSRIPVHTVLDLACGTGSMTWLLAGRGYELIAVDGSQEMLAAAREKNAPAEVPPLFLHHAPAGPVRHRGRRHLLSGQSELSHGSQGCAAYPSAAAPVHQSRWAADL